MYADAFHQILKTRVSFHGYDELAHDRICVRDIMNGIYEGIVVEDYPDFHKGSCVRVLQKDEKGKPIHVVWGIPKGLAAPTVLVTAYRPDPERWNGDLIGRKK